MTFIVTLIALLIERFFDWSHLRSWSWYLAYEQLIVKKFASKRMGKHAYVLLALIVIPLLIAVLLLEFILDDWLYGFIRLLFEIGLLIYCLGPQNLWADAFGCINAQAQGDANFAAEKLKSSFDILNVRYSQALHRHLLSSIFIESNRRVFAVIFWFTLLGPIGAVLYRSITLLCPQKDKQPTSNEISQAARFVLSILDWLPVRIFTFLFALGGHFVQVLTRWRKYVLTGLHSNETLLTECGSAALTGEDSGKSKIAEDGSIERSAISLLDRVFVILLVLIAVVTLTT